jgi:pSer/pThr/pTyr-binding forkhead associated (FHA) protein
LKLEVRYPDKPAHEIELKGAMAVLGRDPSCDLVLNDERCSRRHAVLEVTPTGLQIRDAGSANGVFVNGKKRERSSLVVGDLVRLGEVILKVLAAETPGTVVVGPDELAETGTGPAAAPKPAGPSALGTDERAPAAPGARRAPGPPIDAARAAGRPASARAHPRTRPASGRPLTVTVLAALWLVSIFIYVASAAAVPLLGLRGAAAAANVGVSLLLALVSALMAFGLFALKPWARLLQAGLAGLGLLLCPFTLASATTLIYVLRPSTKAAFERDPRMAEDPAEMTFALTLIGTVMLGAGLCAVGILAARFLR